MKSRVYIYIPLEISARNVLGSCNGDEGGDAIVVQVCPCPTQAVAEQGTIVTDKPLRPKGITAGLTGSSRAQINNRLIIKKD